MRLDIEFHDLIAIAAKNRVLKALRLPISDLFYPSFQAVMSGLNASERMLTAHEKILEAIKWGDADEARAWMVRHLKDSQKGYELASLSMSELASLPVQPPRE